MFRFVRHFVISECKGNNKILNTTLFLLFLFKKFAFCMSVYEKTFAYSCLEHMQRFFFISFSPFVCGDFMSALLCRLCGCLLCGSLLSALCGSLLCTLCWLLVSAESRCVVRIGGLGFCCSLFHYACL